MKIYKTQSEVEKDVKNGVLEIQGDVKFECNISIEASIRVIAGNINAWDINARDINAWDINALNIAAGDILYYAFCCVYQGIKCLSVKARRTPAQPPICLEGKLEIKAKQEIETIEIGGVKYDKKEVESRLKDIKPVE